MEEFKTRKCELKDYDFTIQLIRESLFPFVSLYFKPDEETYKKRFEEDYQERTILTANEKSIGFYQIKQDGQNLEIKGLFLIKDFRGKGIGYRLMKEFENNNVKTISLKVWENNPAVEFYKKLGYEIVKEKDHKYLMRKICN
jgi:ribosomal protein S18 acetylase RimI-like enzyme